MEHISPELAEKLREYGYIDEPSLDYMLSRLDEYGYYPDIVAIRPNHYECVLNWMNNSTNDFEPVDEIFTANNRKEAVAKALLWAIEKNSKTWQRALELGAKLGARLKEAGITEEQIKEDVKRIRKEIRNARRT